MSTNTSREEPSRPAQPLAGWAWGPFRLKIPFWHCRLTLAEFCQGFLVGGATGLACVPLFTTYFGLGFEEAVAFLFVQSVLIASAVIVFGEPYAPGWLTPALPLVMTFVLGNSEGFPHPKDRIQAMTALGILFGGLLLLLGSCQSIRVLFERIPRQVQAMVLMGAATGALKRLLVDDFDRFIGNAPLTNITAGMLTLLVVFGFSTHTNKQRWIFLTRWGLLPGLLAGGIIGGLFGELRFEFQTGWLCPPFPSTWSKVSPLSIGWPNLGVLWDCIPIVLVAYLFFAGDWVTGEAILDEGQRARPDDQQTNSPVSTHLSCGIRNVLMALLCPFFPSQGCLWSGAHILVVEKWKLGRNQLRCLSDGLASYYLMGIPIYLVMWPVLGLLRPLMATALMLTLLLTGFACTKLAVKLCRTPHQTASVLLSGTVFGWYPGWYGVTTAVALLWLLGGMSQTETSS